MEKGKSLREGSTREALDQPGSRRDGTDREFVSGPRRELPQRSFMVWEVKGCQESVDEMKWRD